MDKLLLTVPEAAQALGISRCKVYDLIRMRELVSLKLGSLRRIPAAALDAYVARLLDEDGDP
jgi:excisionase family DNA binding protein